MGRKSFLWIFSVGFSVLSAWAEEARFQVRHSHGIKSCHGELFLTEDTVKYITQHNKHARTWKYEDIQQLGLVGDKKVSVVTYEDRKWQFGKDRIFNFELKEGTVSPSIWSSLQARLTKPLVSSLIPELPQAKYQLPVKHQHALSGCQGILEIGDQQIVYRTSYSSDSRIWRYEDISSLGSTGPFQLRLSTMERTQGEYGADKNFIFDLKRRLDPEVYDFMWKKINLPTISTR